MTPESQYPELKKLFKAGFERPHNFDQAEGKELGEWLMAASLPFRLLRANAAVRPAVHPALPGPEAFGHLRSFYKRRLARQGEFTEAHWLASFGYLPIAGRPGGYGHPWYKLSGEALILDVADPLHLRAFVLWRISVLSDTTEDRKTPIRGTVH